jgi:hypothetical protein
VAVLADFFQRGGFAEAGDVLVSLTPTLSRKEREILGALSLRERVAEGRVRETFVALNRRMF